jgi:2-isopropylmalate synthase
MVSRPELKYRPGPVVPLVDRAWPQRTITRAPLWCSSDLRDGNQALIEPMDRRRKRRMFDLLVGIGFKEIEVAFPSASQTDFDFVRSLIEDDLVPNDVTIQVLTPAREDLIARTFASLRGARRATVHFYNATSPLFRQVVFRRDRAGMVEIAVDAARLIARLAAAQPGTDWTFEYSPETFTATELDFAKEISDAVMDVWQPTPARKAILNLPATVEIATPNVYADQIEWMHRHLARRDALILSVHPHNDRGTGVAAAELGVLAGADRVEGCLFGNGERTGNVDLVTLALNLYSQGIDPGLDFSDVDRVRREVEVCNQLPVHPRHPYVGDLVFTAFSGSHQDAIKKGLAARAAQAPGDVRWDVPYLPVDPADLGRSYDAVIRVNSQSGKGGVAYLLEAEYGLDLPRRLQIEMSRAVQEVADSSGKEITAADIHALFRREYLDRAAPHRYVSHRVERDQAAGVSLRLEHEVDGVRRLSIGRGGDPVQAMLNAMSNAMHETLRDAIGGGAPAVALLDHQVQRARRGAGVDAGAVAYVELRAAGGAPVHGAGTDADETAASLKAVASALNRLAAQARPEAAAAVL